MESVVLIVTAVGSLGVFLFQGKTKYFFSLFLHILLVVTAFSWAFRALSAGGLMQFNLLEISGLFLPASIDSLSAFFLTIISITFLSGLFYAHGYLKLYRQARTNRQFSRHHLALLWLHISMLLVSTLRSGAAFLVAWELMAIATFWLVMFEGERKEILKTGVTYLVQMQIGLGLLLTGFLLIRANGYAFGFDGLSTYFDNKEILPLFLLLFIGFGMSAGFVPLHSWLPNTHLAAPSHVSGIMSGVLTQMGFYGILRVLSFVHTDLATIGLFLLVISLLSGLVGIRLAFRQHDGKSILAYSSIANTGIIGIGIGAGLLGLAYKLPVLAALGLTGGILHIANHSLSKSLLFYSMGSIYRATHTRNLEQLGGLHKTMPKTALSFLVGSLAICGLPPFNGFVSEFFIYSGLIKSLGLSGTYLTILTAVILVGLVMISGYTLVGFTKIFEKAFLGTPQSSAAAEIHEVSDDMTFSQLLVGFLILGIGFFPTLFIRLTSKVTALYIPDLRPIREATSTLVYAELGGSLLVGSLMVVLWLRNRPKKSVEIGFPARSSFNKHKREHWMG